MMTKEEFMKALREYKSPIQEDNSTRLMKCETYEKLILIMKHHFHSINEIISWKQKSADGNLINVTYADYPKGIAKEALELLEKLGVMK